MNTFYLLALANRVVVTPSYWRGDNWLGSEAIDHDQKQRSS
jgi:hypothetical protein